MSHREFLPGGSGGVWKETTASGEHIVRRPVGPWTPAVHELLEHLETLHVRGVPRVLGRSETEEILSWIEGETISATGPGSTQWATHAELQGAAAWLREYHEAVRAFRPQHTRWRSAERPLATDEIICHNDPGIANWVVRDGEFVGMIDWDRAGPGKPIDDVAFLCWSGVPLYGDEPWDEVMRRAQLVCDAYGDLSFDELWPAMRRRLDLIAQRWQSGLELGDPGTLHLRDAGVMATHEMRVAQFQERIGRLER